jgi:hypothetical protein
MSLELLELAAATLTDLLPEVVFVGGATVTLWITDPGAPPVRPTKDVDVIVEVTTRSAFHDFESRLRQRGFTEDQDDGVICRWRHAGSGLILDAMPSDGALLGFENRWQGAAIPHAMVRALPSRAVIAVVDALLSAPRFLDGLFGALRSDQASQDRADAVVLPALRAIASTR